ncbi:MAG: CotH kinase family protein [Chloroflexota bacterium]
MYLGRHGLVAMLALLLAVPLFWQEERAVDKTAVPDISRPSGAYQTDIAITFDAPSPQAEVLYTLNGRLPMSETATVYSNPIPLTTTTPHAISLRSRLRWPDGTLGPTQTHSYFLGLPEAIPLLSLTLDPDDFDMLYTNYTERGRDWERLVDAVYHDPHTQSGFAVPAGLRIHGRISRAEAKKSFRLYFRSEYGQAQLNYPLFSCSDDAACPTTFDRLVLHNGGQDAPTLPDVLARVNWTLLRNQLAARLAQEMDTLTTSNNQPALLFVNGEPWGIYLLRERIDDIFLQQQLGLETADMLDTPERIVGDDQVDLGDRQHWDNLLAYVETHDLSDPAAYHYVATQINIENFIDYNLFQIFVANDDWPMHNVRQFRSRGPGGRWHWIIWDIDRGFAFTPPSSIDKNMFLRAEEIEHELTSNKHTLLYRRLLENDQFRVQLLERLAELLDSTFSPANLTSHLDDLVAEIEPVIDYEFGRWQPDRTAWASNVADLYAFAEQRAAIVREQAIMHFGQGAEETAVLQAR